MTIATILAELEALAPRSLQEPYDNAGLIIGSPAQDCTGIMVCLDATEAVIREAAQQGCNLVVAHHPIIFSGLKKINGNNYVEKAVIAAVKLDIAVYAIHTNLDNVRRGVNGMIADKLGLLNRAVLQPKSGMLKKLYSFVPAEGAEKLRQALFAAGAGQIGQYGECSFNSPGTGTFTAGQNTNPYVGERGAPHQEAETRVEVIFPAWLETPVIAAMKKAHPYEEVAYDIVGLDNHYAELGSGLVGDLPAAMEETAFLAVVKAAFGLAVLRHTPLCGKPVKRVALCGGAGSSLISRALSSGAQVYLTADIKYHEFFDANDQLVVADIGHYESEQFTMDLLASVLREKFPTFATLKTTVSTNPVHYFL